MSGRMAISTCGRCARGHFSKVLPPREADMEGLVTWRGWLIWEGICLLRWQARFADMVSILACWVLVVVDGLVIDLVRLLIFSPPPSQWVIY